MLRVELSTTAWSCATMATGLSPVDEALPCDMGSDWLKALEIRGPTAFLAFIAAALVVAGHKLRILSLDALPAWAAAVASVAAILFGVLSIPWLVHLAGAPFRRLRTANRRDAQIRQSLSTLTADEMAVLWSMVRDHERTTAAPAVYSFSHVGHHGLMGRDLLVHEAFVGASEVMRIPDDVWSVIKDAPAAEILERLPVEYLTNVPGLDRI